MTAGAIDPVLVEHPSDLDGPQPTPADLARALGIVTARVRALESEVAELRAQVRPAPVTSCAGASRVLGVSEDTILRHCDAAGGRPARWWWSSPAAVREWWADLHTQPAPPKGRNPRASGKALDPRQLVRELRGASS